VWLINSPELVAAATFWDIFVHFLVAPNNCAVMVITAAKLFSLSQIISLVTKWLFSLKLVCHGE
jgi:hypothetical protein